MLFKEFKVIFNGQDEVLKKLDIQPSGNDKFIGTASIDLERVEAYSSAESHEGQDTVNLYMCSGDVWSLIINYEEFKKLL